MQEAITSGQLVLHFQPKAWLRTGQIAGVEALVRWQHPVRGLVYPDEFIDLAERAGLGRLLTLEVIAQALQAERAWRSEGMHVPVAVNTSAATLLDLRFPDDVAALLEHWEAPPGALSLELTEETIMTDPERAQDVLARLSELGIDLSLDDFGTGYSSLSMLKRLPVRELKIDRSFVIDLLEDAEDAAIVRSTVELAREPRAARRGRGRGERGGVGPPRGVGLRPAQGYHLSRPLPEDELRALLATRLRVLAGSRAAPGPRRDDVGDRRDAPHARSAAARAERAGSSGTASARPRGARAARRRAPRATATPPGGRRRARPSAAGSAWRRAGACCARRAGVTGRASAPDEPWPAWRATTGSYAQRQPASRSRSPRSTSSR